MSRTASSTNQALHYYRVVYPIRHCKRCSYFLGINEFQASEIINLVLVEIICLVVVGEKMFIFLFFREDFIWPSHHGPRVPVSGHRPTRQRSKQQTRPNTFSIHGFSRASARSSPAHEPNCTGRIPQWVWQCALVRRGSSSCNHTVHGS